MTLGDPGPFEAGIRDGFEQFLTSITTRIKYLELSAWGSANSPNTHLSILKSSLKHCVPGVLTHFTMKNPIWAIPTFLQSEETSELLADPDWPGGILMDDSYEPMEELWQRVTSLRVFGLYPYWTSAAYCGLAELCLEFGLHPDETIAEAHLVSILSSCPGLRVLRLDSAPFNSLPPDAEVAPVYLGQLEVLDVANDRDHNVGSLLRWITPGSGSLAISFTGRGRMNDYLTDANVKAFFARSTIAKIRLAKTDVSYPGITQVFGLSPDLQVLVLDHLEWKSSSSMAIIDEGLPNAHDISTKAFWLDRLEITKCTINYRNFKRFLKRNMIQTIPTLGCRFEMTAGQAPRKAGWDVLEELFDHCVTVEHCSELSVFYHAG